MAPQVEYDGVSWNPDDKYINTQTDIIELLDGLLDSVAKSDPEVQIIGERIFVDISKVKFGSISPRKRNYIKHEDIRMYMAKRPKSIKR